MNLLYLTVSVSHLTRPLDPFHNKEKSEIRTANCRVDFYSTG